MPNPLDLAIFKPQKKITQPDQITILHVGRMERVKGIEVLLQAVPVVLQTCPKAQFIFAGDGSVEYTAALKKQLANFDLEDDQIIFTGVISQDQLIGLYQEADIAVVPSLNYESFSYTVAQAMACALPVVASCIGGIPETVGNENAAILIKPGDVQCLANALITLCQNKELRKEMGKNGRSRAEEYFSADKVGEKIIKSYAQISK
jgi:glycosyltransferase involved in cell wall biosynthesis